MKKNNEQFLQGLNPDLYSKGPNLGFAPNEVFNKEALEAFQYFIEHGGKVDPIIPGTPYITYQTAHMKAVRKSTGEVLVEGETFAHPLMGPLENIIESYEAMYNYLEKQGVPQEQLNIIRQIISAYQDTAEKLDSFFGINNILYDATNGALSDFGIDNKEIGVINISNSEFKIDSEKNYYGDMYHIFTADAVYSLIEQYPEIHFEYIGEYGGLIKTSEYYKYILNFTDPDDIIVTISLEDPSKDDIVSLRDYFDAFPKIDNVEYYDLSYYGVPILNNMSGNTTYIPCDRLMEMHFDDENLEEFFQRIKTPITQCLTTHNIPIKNACFVYDTSFDGAFMIFDMFTEKLYIKNNSLSGETYNYALNVYVLGKSGGGEMIPLPFANTLLNPDPDKILNFLAIYLQQYNQTPAIFYYRLGYQSAKNDAYYHETTNPFIESKHPELYAAWNGGYDEGWDEPQQVTVTIDGENVHLDPDLSYFSQDYTELYTQDYYDSSEGETASDYQIDTSTTYPGTGDSYWTYCHDEYEPQQVIVNIDDEFTNLWENMTYYDNGYDTLYTQNHYDSSEGETAEEFQIDTDDRYPEVGEVFCTYCGDEYEPTEVEVYIDGTPTEIDPHVSYYDNGYETLYTQDYYDSSEGETAEQFQIDTNTRYPEAGDDFWTYCHDEHEPQQVTVTINDEDVNLWDDETYNEQGYETLYTQDYYDGNAGETPETFQIDTSTTYPRTGDSYWTYCHDSSEEQEE